jgi:hypothetical protein
MRKIVSIFVVLCVVAVCAGALWTYIHGTPPKDAALVKQFYAHRGEFEKLRAMLQQDGHIRGVASYGLSTTNRNEVDPLTPEQARLSKANEYLKTLKKAGALLAAHDPEEFYFLIKRWGFAGEGWGIAVVARTTAPTNQLASMDDYFAARNSTEGAYRHIEGDWYFWMK